MNDFIASILLLGAVSTSDGYLPFWMTTNQNGIMPERNGGLALVQAKTQFDESKILQYRWGVSIAANAYNNPLQAGHESPNVMIDELYTSLRWKKLTLDLGIKHREYDFLGASEQLGSLSVTGGHLIETGNARSMPGYLLSMDPVSVPLTKEHLKIYGAFGDYATTDNRFMKDALIHRMRAGFCVTPIVGLSFDAILDHYAIWGGNNPDPHRKQVDVSLKNYIRIFFGMKAGEDGTIGDRVNVIGDHGGSESFRITYKSNRWEAIAQHEIPYADKSGMRFVNFPDGVNTLSFSFKDKDQWISDIVYEHQYTMYQSGTEQNERIDGDGNVLPTEGSVVGGDNYFNNGGYRSGWTYYGRVIGDPLFVPTGTHTKKWTSANMTLGIENNRIKSHHLGIGGKLFCHFPYRIMMTYSENFGTYVKPYKGESQWNKPWGTVKEVGLKQLSFAFTGLIDSNNVSGLSFLYGLYADKGELLGNTIGFSLGLRYNIHK